MKKVRNSFLIAFSMYSKIPVPHADWDKENMQYAMCFFPLIGAIIGAIAYGAYYLAAALGFGETFATAIILVIPVLITGGIHMDGFIDTVDALSSYQPKERKLEILKDPHTGAFAIIYAIVYFIVLFGVISEAVSLQSNKVFMLLGASYCLSRGFSGLSVVSLRCAKNSGLLAMFSSAAKVRFVRIVMSIWIVAACAFMVMVHPVVGLLCLISAIAVYLLYRHISYKQFGGITGDLAGFFLQICELVLAAVIVIACRLL